MYQADESNATTYREEPWRTEQLIPELFRFLIWARTFGVGPYEAGHQDGKMRPVGLVGV